MLSDVPCIAPLVKHAGGKRRIAKRLFGLLGRPPALAELFAGGLAVSCMTPTRPAVVAEAIPPLAALYRQIATDPAALWAELDAAPPAVESREQFDALKAQFNEAPTGAGYLVLNGACFNGLPRFNAAGAFNAAVGKPLPRVIRRYTSDERAAIERLFAGCEVFDDWRPALERAVALDIPVYADPPYVGTFGYAGTPWTLDDLDELAAALPAGAVLSERRGAAAEAQGRLFRAASVDAVLLQRGFGLAFEWTGRNAISCGDRSARAEGVWQKGGPR